MPDFSLEIRHGRKEGKVICGIDEVGRGPLAGPVVACAVVLPAQLPRALRREIKDSKKMTRQAREDIFAPLAALCLHAVAEATVEEIDRLNILWASMLAMERTVAALDAVIDIALIDGDRIPKLSCRAEAVVGGDDISLSIAAASILAKVRRDRFMQDLAAHHPQYGWEHNAGYSTPDHLKALERHGPTAWHRMSFEPCRAARALKTS